MGPAPATIRKSFPGDVPSVVREIPLDGAVLQVRAKSTINVDSAFIRIQPDVDFVMKDKDGREALLARMTALAVYEFKSPGERSIEEVIGSSLKALGKEAPDGLAEAARVGARASMKMSAVLMAEIHLDYLREEDFAEAWRSAHVLHVMET